jgi:dolichyl-phosphate-mannose--protein O-mannosyl transferase
MKNREKGYQKPLDCFPDDSGREKMGTKDYRKYLIVLVLLTGLGFALRVYGLSAQPLSSDDFSVGVSAFNYVRMGRLGPTMWNHPDLRNLLVFLSISLLGHNAWGLKLFSLLFGTLAVPLTGAVAKRIFSSNEVSWLAALFLAIDPLHIDFSRQAVHEVYMPFFSLLGIYLALRFLDRQKILFLVLSGVAFGLGIASKWYVAFPLIITYIYLVFWFITNSKTTGEKTAQIGFITAALVILPLTVYTLTFIPWFTRGYSVPEWFFLQKAMFLETATHTGYNPFRFDIDHQAYLWFIKPVAFADFIYAAGKPRVLLGLANPFTWLPTFPSMLYLFFQAKKKKAHRFFLLLGLFVFSYLPFLATQRPIWAHTAFSVLPFAFLGVAHLLYNGLKGFRFSQTLLIAYLVLTLLTSIPLYFLAVGKGLDIPYLKPVIEVYKPVEH